MTNLSENKQPDFIAYSVKNYGDNQSNWTRIGVAWSHQDSEGFNIVLDNLPLDGKLTLRAPKFEETEKE